MHGLESRGEQEARVQGAGHGTQQSFTVNQGRTGEPWGERVKVQAPCTGDQTQGESLGKGRWVLSGRRLEGWQLRTESHTSSSRVGA